MLNVNRMFLSPFISEISLAKRIQIADGGLMCNEIQFRLSFDWSDL